MSKRYYIILGIIDNVEPVKNAVGWTLVYDNRELLEEDFPGAPYIEAEEIREEA